MNHRNFSNTEPIYTKYSFMESLLNYLANEVKTKVVDLLTMAIADHSFLDLQLSKVNFNGLIMQFEQIFRKSLVFPDCSYLKVMLSKVN